MNDEIDWSPDLSGNVPVICCPSTHAVLPTNISKLVAVPGVCPDNPDDLIVYVLALYPTGTTYCSPASIVLSTCSLIGILLIAAAVSKMWCTSDNNKSVVPFKLLVNLALAGIDKPNSIALLLIALWASSILVICPEILDS